MYKFSCFGVAMKYFVVSDIHGYYSSLQKALTQKGFDIDDPNHMLIICGDMMDRGDCPVQMQTYVKQLIIKKKVILIRGNHEDVAVDLIRNYYKYYKQIKNTHYFSNGTFQTLLALTNMTINSAMRFPIRFIYKAKRTPYIKFIIPRMLDYYETNNYIFVHGWIPCITKKVNDHSSSVESYNYDSNWRNADGKRWRAARWYDGIRCAKTWQILEGDKTIVCGHRGAVYGHEEFENDMSDNFSPFYSKGIIAIDTCTYFTQEVNCVVIDD